MEERLKGLRKSMENTTFSQLHFTDQHRKNIYGKIKKNDEGKEDIMLAVLQILKQEKTGYEIMQLLRARGIQKYEGEEGFLYTMLHELEQDKCIISRWSKSGKKHYHIGGKGTKYLQRLENNSTHKGITLKELMGR
ncbi:PadR family transcriptional regulator [Oceanobacillus kapialis]|uniref:PadR family transcriptional regulator n=1 Tax=Oceanobacillus kapialis TaxID=481353 RepID=UPI0038516202